MSPADREDLRDCKAGMLGTKDCRDHIRRLLDLARQKPCTVCGATPVVRCRVKLLKTAECSPGSAEIAWYGMCQRCVEDWSPGLRRRLRNILLNDNPASEG
jgi:hypothetical protein